MDAKSSSEFLFGKLSQSLSSSGGVKTAEPALLLEETEPGSIFQMCLSVKLLKTSSRAEAATR